MGKWGRRLLHCRIIGFCLGAYEDVEQQTEWELLQIVEDVLGGFWEKPVSKWEGRRDAVLDL